RARCPGLVKIFVNDMDGLHGFADAQVMPFEALLELGARYDREHSGAWDPMVDIARPEDLAILVYTSGTTGPPKGAMLSHRNIVTQMRHCMDVLSWCEDDERLAFLPACHVAERIAGMYYAIATGVVSNYAERPETVPEDIREVQPTLFGAVPRVWERFYSAVMIALKD